jgi:hypothetical protein
MFVPLLNDELGLRTPEKLNDDSGLWSLPRRDEIGEIRSFALEPYEYSLSYNIKQLMNVS